MNRGPAGEKLEKILTHRDSVMHKYIHAFMYLCTSWIKIKTFICVCFINIWDMDIALQWKNASKRCIHAFRLCAKIVAHSVPKFPSRVLLQTWECICVCVYVCVCVYICICICICICWEEFYVLWKLSFIIFAVTHYILVMPNGDETISQWWFKQWLVGWQHQAIPTMLTRNSWHPSQCYFTKLCKICWQKV